MKKRIFILLKYTIFLLQFKYLICIIYRHSSARVTYPEAKLSAAGEHCGRKKDHREVKE
jgi:hypothetical protein